MTSQGKCFAAADITLFRPDFYMKMHAAFFRSLNSHSPGIFVFTHVHCITENNLSTNENVYSVCTSTIHGRSPSGVGSDTGEPKTRCFDSLLASMNYPRTLLSRSSIKSLSSCDIQLGLLRQIVGDPSPLSSSGI